MEFRFNTHNENYIMINRWNIFLAPAHFDNKKRNKEENEIFQTFINIQHSIINYEKKERIKGNFYPNDFEIAVEKKSNMGIFLITNQKNPELITFEQITHSLLVCIDREDWKYYDKLTKIIKKFKEKNCTTIDYNSLKIIVGDEMINYIINCQSYSAKKYSSDKIVYLYKKKKIIKTELPEQTIIESKIKKRTIN